jgi:DNA-directed RNA polymerase specialized sigma subunit
MIFSNRKAQTGQVAGFSASRISRIEKELLKYGK